MCLEQKSDVVSVLFVCMGNICRSPTAEAVFRRLIADEAADLVVEIDSAGTHDFHVGHPPDERAQAAARRRGFEMKHLRARQLATEDFDALALAPARFRARVSLLLEYAPDLEVREVPDPYYGGEVGFEHVLDLVEAAARGLIAELRAQQRRT
jgi:protein-tyrosine phosphatase